MSLSLKLYVSIFGVMFIGLAIFTLNNVTNQTNNLLELVQLSALRTTDLIKNSIHYSMLINRKSDIDQIFDNFAKMKGFEVIRMYDKDGRIIFTTVADEKYSQIEITNNTCQACHDSSEPLKALASRDRHRIREIGDGKRVLSMINPIQNEPSCSKTGCHKSVKEQSILGILDVQMSLELVEADIAENRNYTIVTSVLLVVIVLLVVGIIIWTQIRQPILNLISGTKAIAMGDLDYRLKVGRHDEVGHLAESFNTMVSELSKARNEITEWSNTLQQRIEDKTEELERIQTQLIQVEKMASLGKLAATVAHELNNPLAGILTYTRLTLKRLKEQEVTNELLGKIEDDLKIISEETNRCGNIVKNLLLFSRRDVGEFLENDLIDIIKHCIQLLQHYLVLNEINLKQKLPDVPIFLRCDKEQIQQALLAIMVNAVEAMKDGGELSVIAVEDSDQIRISISDTGEGIEEEKIQKIFEPFYSSKTDGNGVGLGLAVAYGIINRHEGNIEVESKISIGSTFTVILPKRSKNKSV